MATQPTSDTPQPNGLPHTDDIMPATNDELLYALRSTVITQGATIKALFGIMIQLFGQMKEIPEEEAWALFEKLYNKGAAVSVAQFNEAIEARRKEVNNSLFQ